MKKNTQEQSAGPRYLRTLAVMGLLVFAILLAPLGQGVGLSAGQGMIQATGSGAADALAAHEVERLLNRR